MNFKRNGVNEWIFQRVSNVLIFCYAIFYIVNVLSMGEVTYDAWVALHSATWFKLYSTVTLVIVMLNAILAGWQIGTDYTQKVPVPGFSVIFHSFYTIVTLIFLVAGLCILWAR
ncbi:succinate dehydrogenase, hydrophobic membrane anchor protein [Planctobacterium marinum]|uniref:succinate dehydrogenase, hydrophobic membrane anchor protein n=1 Tax=Planctobacterium marinum TaxID=1631968 RepID=UPI001E63D635|nr:succinate dehydrogenase, hydrophobic membrane anchor protein [Planctobacterium marinum]MCC2607451.1 succinate dehydrogenase, hydrophobic membrane anchor protein [Planctobacterium marinum]